MSTMATPAATAATADIPALPVIINPSDILLFRLCPNGANGTAHLTVGPPGPSGPSIPPCRVFMVSVDLGDGNPMRLALVDESLPLGTVVHALTPLMERFLVLLLTGEDDDDDDVDDDSSLLQDEAHGPHCHKDVVCLDCSEVFCNSSRCIGLKHAGHRLVSRDAAVPVIDLTAEGEEGDDPMGKDCFCTSASRSTGDDALCPHMVKGTTRESCASCKAFRVTMSAFVNDTDEEEACLICANSLEMGSTIVNCNACQQYMCARCWDGHIISKAGSYTFTCPFCKCSML